ncbi:hypothetical protein DKX38_021836 [Salix brachista]|uniref:Uncharacterized protein n=1 Tax=Salix brachista TaxID=2182728 RepID=A0A5N5KAE8_9ROSI|nr:hypothetical protein DKX38_021836 [Salix brachista]
MSGSNQSKWQYDEMKNMLLAQYSALLYKDGIQMINTRKLLVEVLDYDDAGANRKHDPRGRTGAGGGKNP